MSEHEANYLVTEFVSQESQVSGTNNQTAEEEGQKPKELLVVAVAVSSGGDDNPDEEDLKKAEDGMDHMLASSVMDILVTTPPAFPPIPELLIEVGTTETVTSSVDGVLAEMDVTDGLADTENGVGNVALLPDSTGGDASVGSDSLEPISLEPSTSQETPLNPTPSPGLSRDTKWLLYRILVLASILSVATTEILPNVQTDLVRMGNDSIVSIQQATDAITTSTTAMSSSKGSRTAGTLTMVMVILCIVLLFAIAFVGYYCWELYFTNNVNPVGKLAQSSHPTTKMTSIKIKAKDGTAAKQKVTQSGTAKIKLVKKEAKLDKKAVKGKKAKDSKEASFDRVCRNMKIQRLSPISSSSSLAYSKKNKIASKEKLSNVMSSASSGKAASSVITSSKVLSTKVIPSKVVASKVNASSSQMVKDGTKLAGPKVNTAKQQSKVLGQNSKVGGVGGKAKPSGNISPAADTAKLKAKSSAASKASIRISMVAPSKGPEAKVQKVQGLKAKK